MSHRDEDLLAAIAMGDDVSHELSIDEAERVKEYEQMVARLSSLEGPVALRQPRASVWSAIQADIAAESDSDDGPVKPHALRSTDGSADTADELAARRERKRAGVSPWLVGVAAAAGAVIGGVGVSTLAGTDDAPGEIVAQAPLTDLASEADAGIAYVHTLPDGTEVLVLETEFEPVDGAALEVWLIDPNVEGMISLGHLTPDSTSFVIPAGFDISEFPIVDVSIEPFDGDPTHSGNSVTRGVFDA